MQIENKPIPIRGKPKVISQNAGEREIAQWTNELWYHADSCTAALSTYQPLVEVIEGKNLSSKPVKSVPTIEVRAPRTQDNSQ